MTERARSATRTQPDSLASSTVAVDALLRTLVAPYEGKPIVIRQQPDVVRPDIHPSAEVGATPSSPSVEGQTTSSLLDLLRSQRQAIIGASADALERSCEPHYVQQGSETASERLARLLDLVTVSVEQRDLVPMIDYSTAVANERFDAGFDIREVQRAFHVLEEAIWERIVDTVPHRELAESLGLVGTVVGAGRDALARTYVSRASQQHVPSLDLSALFRGGT